MNKIILATIISLILIVGLVNAWSENKKFEGAEKQRFNKFVKEESAKCWDLAPEPSTCQHIIFNEETQTWSAGDCISKMFEYESAMNEVHYCVGEIRERFPR